MAAARRALVLGGGGVTGVAWELGLIAGLAERGLDLAAADLIVGTSAGSVVGAQVLSGRSIEDLYEAQLADPGGEIAARMGVGAMARFLIASLWPDARAGRSYLGHAALAARTVSEAQRRAVIESRLPSQSGLGQRCASWPSTPGPANPGSSTATAASPSQTRSPRAAPSHWFGHR